MMRNLHLKLVGLFLSAFLSLPFIQAQDFHFSQFSHAPTALNPALAGMHRGDNRMHLNYRNQWQSVSPFYTVSGVYNQKFLTDKQPNRFWTGSVIFNYDQAGTSKLSLTNLHLSGAYTLGLSESMFLSVGVQGGISQRAFKTNDLTFDRQFDGDSFNGDIPQPTINNSTIFYADFATGLNLRIQDFGPQKSRSKIDIGTSLYHLTRPQTEFLEGNNYRLPMRFNAHVFGIMGWKENWDVVFQASTRYQQPYLENALGLGAKFHLSQRKSRELALSWLLTYRFSENATAIIPQFGIDYQFWNLSLSYDMQLSQIANALGVSGGPEVSFHYYIFKLRAPTKVKLCKLL